MKHFYSNITSVFCLLLILLLKSATAQNIESERLHIKYLQPPSIAFRPDATKYRITADVVAMPFGYSVEGTIQNIQRVAKLQGDKFEEVQSGADIEIQVRLDRFVNDSPKITSRQETREKSDKTKETITFYTGQAMIAWPMFIRVRDLKEDKTLYEGFMGQSDNLTSVKMIGEKKTAREAQSQLDYEIGVKRDELFRKLITDLQHFMRMKFSFYPTYESWSIKYVETSKKANYDDVNEAKDIAKKVLERLTDTTTDINESDLSEMNSAIEKWEAILREANFDDRKARIDKKVARNICENIAVCSFFMHDFTKAQKYVNQAREILKEQWTYALEDRIKDMKDRFDANNIGYR